MELASSCVREVVRRAVDQVFQPDAGVHFLVGLGLRFGQGFGLFADVQARPAQQARQFGVGRGVGKGGQAHFEGGGGGGHCWPPVMPWACSIARTNCSSV